MRFISIEHSRATTIPVVIFKAGTEGFEPPTNSLEVNCSIQLSYVPISYRWIRCDITQGNITPNLYRIIYQAKEGTPISTSPNSSRSSSGMPS